MHRRIVLITMGMAVLHGAVIYFWREPFGDAPVVRETPDIELVLETSIPAPLLPQPERVPAPESPSSKAPVVNPMEVQAARSIDMKKPPERQPLHRLELPLPGQRLQHLPDEFFADPGSMSSGQADGSLGFRADLAEAVQRRRADQRRNTDSADARTERLGVGAAAYNQVEGRNRHIKVGQSCFDRVDDVEKSVGDGTGGHRFWMTKCRETRRGDWRLFADETADDLSVSVSPLAGRDR